MLGFRVGIGLVGLAPGDHVQDCFGRSVELLRLGGGGGCDGGGDGGGYTSQSDGGDDGQMPVVVVMTMMVMMMMMSVISLGATCEHRGTHGQPPMHVFAHRPFPIPCLCSRPRSRENSSLPSRPVDVGAKQSMGGPAMAKVGRTADMKLHAVMDGLG